MVVLAQEERYTRLFAEDAGREVQVDGEVEERVCLAPRDEGYPTWAVGVSVEAGQVERGGREAQGVWVAGGRDGVVLCDGRAPVDEVWGD